MIYMYTRFRGFAKRPAAIRKALNRLQMADGAMPRGKYVFGSPTGVEMAGGREPGKYVIRIIVDPLTLPDTCAVERYGADTGAGFSPPALSPCPCPLKTPLSTLPHPSPPPRSTFKRIVL